MSGHSHWAGIKHKKAANDAKRGKVFSRLSKAIAIAVREGGGDNPEFNPKLRLEIDRAKAENMPKNNIQRAIDRGAGRVEGAAYEQITYEGFGPDKVAMLVECITDNKNRTNSDIKTLFDKNGGVLGSAGSTAYFFDRKGQIEIKIPEDQDVEEMQLELIDLGADDFLSDQEGSLPVIVEAGQTHGVAGKMKQAGLEVMSAEVIMMPNAFIDLDDKGWTKFEKLAEAVDDYEDVQRIFTNARKI